MTKSLMSGAKGAPVKPRRVSGDRLLRDEEVPALARRERGTKSTWVVFLRAGGRTRKVTLGDCATLPPDRAREMARDMVAQPEPEDTRSGDRMTVAGFAETFLADTAPRWKASTRETNRKALERHLLPVFGRRRLSHVTREDVTAWLHGSQGSAGAKARALPVLSSLFAHAELLGLLPPRSNPCKGLRRHKSGFAATYLDAEGFAALGAALRAQEAACPQAVALIRFVALTGCRRGEALDLTWAMIDGNRAALPDAKSGPKAIWLGRATRRLLSSLPRHAPFVFGRDGQPLPKTMLAPVWDAVRRDLGHPNLRLHDLRHSYASVAVTLGHDLVVVGGLLGHADKGSTAGYVHLVTGDVARASTRVGRHLGAIMSRAGRASRKEPCLFTTYLRSKQRLDAFCAAHGLDPDTFHKDLCQWRVSTRKGAAR
ncbi:tyrosine-type recombinase/integrase [Palleronia caenipelagi]|uniref:Site-specific integrase n=1 Tax=Palleronia caenipelagi TaxID=2489174 RepID=A0A547PI27_9RHOB|nr:site-specific integrase [Palleronia caenipelagi]TRD13704.1 site-specific integrase [Palleronia caenipelagi]